jgi:hypothetical protein
MGSRLSTLTPTDLESFERDGYLMVRQAFPRDDALAMEQRWWRELEDSHGIRRDDRSTWRQLIGDLKAAKRDPIQARISTGRVRGVIDDLLGKDAWAPPRDWGRPLVTFPEPGAWEVPVRLWHWDNAIELHLDQLRALFVVSFIGPVAPGGGGTVILSGSPRLLIQQQQGRQTLRRPESERLGSITKHRDRFHRSHPWIRALTGLAPSPADRNAAFMDSETVVEGVPVRVVELTGEPGDMVFCHPLMVHCAAANRGQRPRFMRIKTQITARARER